MVTRTIPPKLSQRSVKFGLGMLSAPNVAHILRSGARIVGSALRGLGEMVLNMSAPGKKKRRAVGGVEEDRTLALLDIPHASIAESTSVLAKMLAVHIAIAWLGLLFNTPKKI